MDLDRVVVSGICDREIELDSAAVSTNAPFAIRSRWR
jgi:hypothetical protein